MYEVVKKLFEIYKPIDDITEVEVYERLLQVKMRNKEDPRTLFEQLASIKIDMKQEQTSCPRVR